MDHVKETSEPNNPHPSSPYKCADFEFNAFGSTARNQQETDSQFGRSLKRPILAETCKDQCRNLQRLAVTCKDQYWLKPAKISVC
jgi:hypothetical protein